MKVFETRHYLLHLTPSIAEMVKTETTDGEPILKVKAELCESQAFAYGNQTCVGITVENLPRDINNPMGFDTRYDRRVTESFDGWCRAYFEDYYGKNVEKVEDITA